MVKRYYKTESKSDHNIILATLHTFSRDHPDVIEEIDYHQEPSRGNTKFVYFLRAEATKSNYLFHKTSTVISHISSVDLGDYIELISQSDDRIDSTRSELEKLFGIDLIFLQNQTQEQSLLNQQRVN